MSTSIGDKGDSTFTVTLVAGTYTYICDAHPSMKGTFTVGSVATTTTPSSKHKPKPKKKKKKKQR